MGMALWALLKPAGSALLIFSGCIYAFTIITLQLSLTTNKDAIVDDPDLAVWFCDLSRSFLTFTQIFTFGVDWNDIIQPMLAEMSPAVGIVFIFFVLMGMYVGVGLAASIGADKIMVCVREDKDTGTVHKLLELFGGESDQITWSVFATKLQHKDMMDFFESLDVSPTANQAKNLFELIDFDSSGSLDYEEIVSGLLRLRGPARALDLQLAMKDVMQLQTDVSEALEVVKETNTTCNGIRKTILDAETAVIAREKARELVLFDSLDEAFGSEAEVADDVVVK